MVLGLGLCSEFDELLQHVCTCVRGNRRSSRKVDEAAEREGEHCKREAVISYRMLIVAPARELHTLTEGAPALDALSSEGTLCPRG